ncbi:exported protein of unknown function [Pseudorhizobium banfieldiae]|uniref:Uncharacterized protein n=1 Tax=Pseudorhizobium banfieldiae TaxID=1125847 RepID=L0NDL0_9HYPH|nr:hypothetical protein [Pseudorhizobium banfieldiae]CAD6606311.1 hypothetical protein RNT25_01838 [arsenite-oxidising bacterium NT-25]CCF19183.1 exported protein of unknown function [Pseudorhizobium banfieldiae]
MRHPLHIAVLCIVLSLAAFVAWPAFSQVVDAEPVISPSSVWYDIWTIVQPVIVLLISTVGPVLVAWLSARLIALLKVSDENQKAALEAKLRDALHQSAANALKYALVRAGLPAGAHVAGAVIDEAMRYVEEKNPDALDKLGVHSEALREIIMSKVPDLLGTQAIR